MTYASLFLYLVGAWLLGYLNGVLVGVIRRLWLNWTS